MIAGQEYGTGSSRDWAAKGTALLGVKAVVAQSFERIHRSNLVGMGVLPLQFREGMTAQTLGLDGTEVFDFLGLSPELKPQQDLTLRITRKDGRVENIAVRCRIDTPIEVDYYQHGGILPYVLRQLLAHAFDIDAHDQLLALPEERDGAGDLEKDDDSGPVLSRPKRRLGATQR